MKRLSENGARPVLALGGLNPPPFGRLGALVFPPHNSESLYWAGFSAQTRIAGCAWATSPRTSAGKTLLPKGAPQTGLTARPQEAARPAPAPQKIGSASPTDRRSVFRFEPSLQTIQNHSRQQTKPLPGVDASAILGRTERSGCTAAEPYPLSRSRTLSRRRRPGQTNTRLNSHHMN